MGGSSTTRLCQSAPSLSAAAFLGLLPLSAAPATAPDGLLYLAHFDSYPAATWAVGTRTFAAPLPPPRFVEGRFGKAVSLTGGNGFSIVGDDGNFRPEEGAVEMWIRPNWPGNDGEVHQVFSAYVERGNYLNLNKLADGTLGVATGAAGVGKYCRVAADISAWQAADWHHVAFTWRDGTLALFIDGQEAGESDGSIPPKRPPPQIRVAATLDGAIDELAIWARPPLAFATKEPIAAPDMGEAGLPEPRGLRVTELDRYLFDLADPGRGCVIAAKHFLDEVDPGDPPETDGGVPRLSTFSARDERQSLGFVVYATADLQQLSFRCTDLRSPAGVAIPSRAVTLFLNRRVRQRRAPRVPDGDRVPVASLLDPARVIDLPAGHFKEVTVTVHVPAAAVENEYRGSIIVSAESGTPEHAIPLAVRVLPFRLRSSQRKRFGVYLHRLIDLSPHARESLRADLRDLREHGVIHLFCHLGIEYRQDNAGVKPSYDRLDEGLALLREFGFRGAIIIQSGFQELAALLGHEDAKGRRAQGKSLDESQAFATAVETAIGGLAPLKREYVEFELVLTHMDEVLNRGRLPLYTRLTRPVRRVPEQRVYITLHTLPRPGVPELTRQLAPYMDIRCYNGHALDLWLQAGHSFKELGRELEQSGDEGWMYYNPHRPFFTAEWARIVNGLYLWWSPLRVHCPFRYRTMREYPLSFPHNMGFTVKSLHDLTTPIATRQWEGYRLGAQDAWYFCALEDLLASAGERTGTEVAAAREWVQYLRSLMPSTDEMQSIAEEQCKDYPVLYTVAGRLDGAEFERLRLRTAEHILALRRRLGITD